MFTHPEQKSHSQQEKTVFKNHHFFAKLHSVTESLPLKNDGWETNVFLWGGMAMFFFGGELLNFHGVLDGSVY